MKFFGIRDDLILPEERKWNWGIDDSFRNLKGFFDHLCSKKTSLNGARLNPECPSIKGEIFKRVRSDGKRGALIQVAFSSAVLAREFRRLEPISAFEVSILVLMEQASCCTSVKTGSNFNWIPRLDFIGRVPIRRGEETELAESGKFPARFLIVDPVSLSANREFLKRCSRRGKIDSRENFSMKESTWLGSLRDLIRFEKNDLLACAECRTCSFANFLSLFFVATKLSVETVSQTDSWKIDESSVEEKQFF